MENFFEQIGETMNIVNISGYKFIPVADPEELRDQLMQKCTELELKGTILIGNEGINQFLAGPRQAIDGYVDFLQQDSRFADITFKESFSDYVPFCRMVVKVRKEIVTMGGDEIAPGEFTGPSIDPKEFKQWIDEGKDFTILDTRNDFEFELGTFKDAIHLDIEYFRQFPDEVAKLDPEIKEKPVVIFCTGGIRCEKASPAMLNQGFKEVYQLEGGILKYFEECGGEHYEGECFVFDDRVALDGNLQETDTEVCYRCQQPLSVEQRQHELYVEGEYCQYCYKINRGRFRSGTQVSTD